MQKEARQDRKILKILCYDVYDLVKKIVMTYSEKQEEKTIVKSEELFVNSMYRDLFDSDIFGDFSMLYKDDCKIIDIIQKIPPQSADGFRKAIQDIVTYLSRSDNKE